MNYLNQIKSIILGLILAFGLSFAGATWTAPTSSAPTNGSVSAPIDTSAADQAKAGTLAVASTSIATNPYVLETVGYILSTGLAVSGGADIQGSIKADTLVSSGSQKVCADGDGVLSLCAGDEFSIIYDYSYSPILLSIPSNVDSMTVELWGAGGGNYSSASTDGDDSYIYYSGYGTSGKIIAEGGSKGGVSAGGAGGSYTTPTYAKYSYVSTVSGGNGQAGGDASGKVSNGCDINTGNTGGDGGQGGTSNGVSADAAGTGGAPGSSSVSCGSFVMNVGSYGTSGNGATASNPGVGGSGYGGKGGHSGSSIDPNDPQYDGEDGSSGGGGGGYVKAVIDVAASEQYYLFVGSFGDGGHVWAGGGMAPSGWPSGGAGGNGRIKITFTLI